MKPLKTYHNQPNTLVPVLTISVLFFVFGFVTWANSILIPYLKIACELNNLESYLVAFAFYIAYLVMAVPSGWLLKKTGFKKGMSTGLFIMAIGAAIFIPAAANRQYAFFLIGLFVQGTGLAVLQTASNPYITILGPIESAAKRICIMGIFNKIAGAIAPIILGAITLKDADAMEARLPTMHADEKQLMLNQLAERVIFPYIIIVAVLLVLSMIIYLIKLPEITPEKEEQPTAKTPSASVFQFPHLMVGVLALFVYVGAEVLAGDSIVNYGGSQGISLSTSKFFTAFTMCGMIAGYIIGIICIPKYMKQEKALIISSVLGVLFSIMAIVTSGYISVLCIALLGFANALIWPSIWPLALRGLGSFTKTGSSLLIMGIAGGAVIPLIYGWLSDILNLQQGYVILVPCYLIIFYFGVWGQKLSPAKVSVIAE